MASGANAGQPEKPPAAESSAANSAPDGSPPSAGANAPRDPKQTPQTPNAGAKKKSDTSAETWQGLLIVGVFALGIGLVAWLVLGSGTNLDVQAYAVLVHPSSLDKDRDKEKDKGKDAETKDTWTVHGRVLRNDAPLEGVSVSAVALDELGNTYPALGKADKESSPIVITGTDGRFVFERIPTELVPESPARPKVRQIRISARQSRFLRPELRGEAVLQLAELHTRSWSFQYAAGYVVFLLIVFFVSILSALLSRKWSGFYYVCMVLAVFFMFLIVGGIVYAQYSLFSGPSKEDEVLNMGVAYVFRGTYVKEVAPELLISLTAPPAVKPPTTAAPLTFTPEKPAKGEGAKDMPTAKSDDKETKAKVAETSAVEVVRGLGAPLWVVLIGVLGAALFTIGLIIREIKAAPDDNTLPKRVPAIIEHQFFLLFAPLGAIFLFQLLVQAGSASQHVTVAIAALASGLLVNWLLKTALTTVHRLIGNGEGSEVAHEPSTPPPPGAAGAERVSGEEKA